MKVTFCENNRKKNEHKINNSVEFANEGKRWKIFPTEIQGSYDFVHVFLLARLLMSFFIIAEYLIKDSTNVKTGTKLTLVDIHQLIDLCESECYFSYNNLILKLYNSGPIGLSIMVVLSKCYYQRFEEKSIALSFALNVSHKTLKRYVDYSRARFENKQRYLQVVEILNKQDAFIQYTI